MFWINIISLFIYLSTHKNQQLLLLALFNVLCSYIRLLPTVLPTVMIPIPTYG